MSYIEHNLSQDEEIKLTIKLHWLNYVSPSLIGLLALLSMGIFTFDEELRHFPLGKWLILILVLWTAYSYLVLYMTEMVVTTKRVICKKGIISIKTEELKNNKIESVEIKQSVLDRLLGYGDLWFSGTGSSKVLFATIDDPCNIKKQIDDIINP